MRMQMQPPLPTGLLPSLTEHGAEVKITPSYLWFVSFGMSLHILHCCECLKSTDDPPQDKQQNALHLLEVLITGAKPLE